MSKRVDVEWGSSGFIYFRTMEHIGEGDYLEVEPDDDTVIAWLETFEPEPQPVQELVTIWHAVGVYLVKFYADKALYNVGDQFYITLYWSKGGAQMCERVPAAIHTDL